MKEIKILNIEDCLDGSFIREIITDLPLTKDRIFMLSNGFMMNYFDTFARPFFKIVNQNQFEIKGVEGNNSFRIHIFKNYQENLNFIIKRINSIN